MPGPYHAGSFFENFVLTSPQSLPPASSTPLHTYRPPVPSIAAEDIGKQVATLLTGTWTGKKIVELGDLVSPDEIAQAMSEVLGLSSNSPPHRYSPDGATQKVTVLLPQSEVLRQWA